MSDTQWPRFEVFQQAQPEGLLVHNGSVHAPDIEMALLNARDVFARRPRAVALWVAPAEAILSRTREELIAQRPLAEEGQAAIYYVFGKLSQQAQAQLLGEFEAGSASAALARAMQQFEKRNVLRWWVVPAATVVKSRPEDAGPMFTPGSEKTFKDQAEYPVVTMMRELRSKRKKGGK